MKPKKAIKPVRGMAVVKFGKIIEVIYDRKEWFDNCDCNKEYINVLVTPLK